MTITVSFLMSVKMQSYGLLTGGMHESSEAPIVEVYVSQKGEVLKCAHCFKKPVSSTVLYIHVRKNQTASTGFLF